MTADAPVKASFLMRLSFLTPQMSMNYGSGVLKTIPYLDFVWVSFVVGLPHTMLVILLGKEIKDIKGTTIIKVDIFQGMPSSESNTLRVVEGCLLIVAFICLSLMSYFLVKYWRE